MANYIITWECEHCRDTQEEAKPSPPLDRYFKAGQRYYQLVKANSPIKPMCCNKRMKLLRVQGPFE